jgi:uncharacterized metal-binding protein YceD (DUF177 family)
MLTIPLVKLEKQGSLEIHGAISPEDPGWEGTELRFSTSLSVSGRVLWLPSGDVLARLRLQGLMAQECRRCLEPVSVTVDEGVEILFTPQGESAEFDDDGSRPLPAGMLELDLVEAVREELVLSLSPFALCGPGCKGLCPHCGVNLNLERCVCSAEGDDPRWDVLRALNKGRE